MKWKTHILYPSYMVDTHRRNGLIIRTQCGRSKGWEHTGVALVNSDKCLCKFKPLLSYLHCINSASSLPMWGLIFTEHCPLIRSTKYSRIQCASRCAFATVFWDIAPRLAYRNVLDKLVQVRRSVKVYLKYVFRMLGNIIYH